MVIKSLIHKDILLSSVISLTTLELLRIGIVRGSNIALRDKGCRQGKSKGENRVPCASRQDALRRIRNLRAIRGKAATKDIEDGGERAKPMGCL
jgi:hypothetical protein